MHRKEQDSSSSVFLDGLAEVSSEDPSRSEFQLTRSVAGAVPKFPVRCKDFTGRLRQLRPFPGDLARAPDERRAGTCDPMGCAAHGLFWARPLLDFDVKNQ